jgi:hypothetical protein
MENVSSSQYDVRVTSKMIDGVRRTRTEFRERNTKPLVRTEASHPWQLHSAPLPSCPLPPSPQPRTRTSHSHTACTHGKGSK